MTLHSELYAVMSPAAPTPLELNIQGYKHYLSLQGGLKDSPKLMAATEEAFQYLLKMSSANLTEKESRDKLLVELNMKTVRLEALHSSLSWRLTKPLRWLGDRVRMKDKV